MGSTMEPRKSVLAVIEDLFFLVKVKDAATKAGLDIQLAKSPEAAVAKVRTHQPVLVVVDLNATTLQPLETIRALKSEGVANMLAFVSHVQVDLKRQGQEAGADRVIARSAFSEKLNALMSEAAATRDNEAECGIATGSPPDS
jgi:CheY-like chemotaxis protein